MKTTNYILILSPLITTLDEETQDSGLVYRSWSPHGRVDKLVAARFFGPPCICVACARNNYTLSTMPKLVARRAPSGRPAFDSELAQLQFN